MNNVLIVVQARANSKRLPNKIWADLHGKPMLQHVLERARHIGPEVFVATPPPGLDENDVLGRFKLVSEYYPDVEHFVRLTADCPLLDVGVAKRILEEHLRGGWDFTGTSYNLDGLDVECFTCGLLEMADVHDHDDREHVTKWMRMGAKHSLITSFGGWKLDWSVDDARDLLWARRVMKDCQWCYAGVPHHTNARGSIGGNDGRWPVWDLHDLGQAGLTECTAHDTRMERAEWRP